MPSFFSDGNTPRKTDTQWTILQKILGAVGSGSSSTPRVVIEPSSINPDEVIGLMAYATGGLAGVTSITVNDSTTDQGYDFSVPGDSVESISFPNLVSVTGGGYITITDLPSLTSVGLDLLEDTPYLQISGNVTLSNLAFPSFSGVLTLLIFTGNALNAASVNGILASLVAIPTWGNLAESVDLSLGTNAAPSGQGVTDKNTLIARGATVTTN